METIMNVINLKAKEQNFSGVISIFKNNNMIYNEAFGYKEVKNRLLNTTDTKFGIASGTKFFTALGIGKLIEENKLSFSTKIIDIDNDFSGFIDENATILNLLTHTSGVYDYLDEEEIEDYENFYVDIPWYKLVTSSDYLPLFKDKKMKFQANNRFSYSNGGYVLLGIIIERLTNKLYRDFIKDNVLTPAGMSDSGFYAFNDLPENTAAGYLEDGKTINIYKIPIRGGGDGGMYTTSDDLNSFWKALFSNRILSKELTEEFLKTHINLSEKSGYGCGVYKNPEKSTYLIVGGDAGVGFDSRYFLEEDIIINILSNKSNGEEEMREIIREQVDKYLAAKY